ncbi:MAG: chemotaxis protein CheR [Gammaproteobacteria bacterium]|nr:MAG: chemotaxis protein CheR [Gammaproteobacteria bacterium]RLA15354.1 MAG: chemotaxis protein CheR [Gammaproteobacteria bacterium]RLA15640.1 MAG: chemotaxis protein CheR [Gammaproteobacteria bacterium]
MNTHAALRSPKEFELTDNDFNRLRELVTKHTGINLSDAKRTLVYSRISRRLRELGLNQFKDYCDLIEQRNSNELENFSNAISTNLTAFFRESHHFDYLANTVLPQILANNHDRQRLRIWSAGCSTGEEPYSLAMVVSEVMPKNSTWDIKILATDLDTQVLATAKRGVYGPDRTSGLSPQRLKRWFTAGKGDQQGKVRVVPELQQMITFKQLNLMHDWPMRGPFDVVFCRNVVIYFDKPTQRVLFQRIAELMPAASHLLIGHSETLFNVSEQFELIGKTIYQRNQ